MTAMMRRRPDDVHADQVADRPGRPARRPGRERLADPTPQGGGHDGGSPHRCVRPVDAGATLETRRSTSPAGPLGRAQRTWSLFGPMPLTLVGVPSGANEWWKVNACGAVPWSWRCSSLETPSCQVGITPSKTHQHT